MMGRQTGDQGQLFYLFNLERRIPADHLLRRINPVVTRIVVEALLDALEEQYRRARAPHGRQDHTHRRAGMRIEPIGDHLRPPAQSINEIQEMTIVAKTVDLEPHGREPVFDPPAILLSASTLTGQCGCSTLSRSSMV